MARLLGASPALSVEAMRERRWRQQRHHHHSHNQPMTSSSSSSTTSGSAPSPTAMIFSGSSAPETDNVFVASDQQQGFMTIGGQRSRGGEDFGLDLDDVHFTASAPTTGE